MKKVKIIISNIDINNTKSFEVDDDLQTRSKLRKLIIENKLKKAKKLIKNKYEQYYKNAKIVYLFHVLEYVNHIRQSYPKTKEEYLIKRKKQRERINKQNEELLKTIDIDAEIAKLQELQKNELLKQHENLINEGMMKLFNTKTNYQVDPITKNIVNNMSGNDASSLNTTTTNTNTTATGNDNTVLQQDDDEEKTDNNNNNNNNNNNTNNTDANKNDKKNNEADVDDIIDMKVYEDEDDHLYDQHIIDSITFAKKHFQREDCLVGALMALIGAPDYNYFMNQKYRIQIADEINAIIMNLQYGLSTKKKQIKEKIRPPTRIARLTFNHNSNNDDDNNNNDDEFTIEYENYHEDDDDVDLLQQHNNEDDTDVREDIHFRIDSEVWKQKKLKEIEDMKQIFGPALPPEMALAREHKLNEEESEEAEWKFENSIKFFAAPKVEDF